MQETPSFASLARRRGAALGLALATVLAASVALAAPAPEEAPVLTAEQEALVDDLTHALVAPCCWTASVAEHGSGQAPVVEAEVRQMVAADSTRDAILAYYIDKYGERILVEPRRRGFNRLAYWTPWTALVAGALGIVWFVRKRRPGGRSTREETREQVTKPSAPAAPVGDEHRRRVREELLRLDD